MTPDLLQQIERDGAAVDLSTRAKWLVTGSDRVRYLNGQVTNDVRKAVANEALYACVTSAKGRIDGDLFIHAAPGDALSLDAEPGLRETLSARLEKYVVADDVNFEDVTGDWRLLHVCGSAAEHGAWSAGLDAKIRMVKANRLGEEGYDLWIPISCALPPAPCPLLPADEAETLRICRGVPRWPHELNAAAFPQEAGLESRAMDFSKGCYVGQEVLSRIKTTGRMPRRLVRFQVQDSAFRTRASGDPEPSWRLWARSADGLKEAGAVTSACLHPVLDRVMGLAYVRQGMEQEHSLLLAPEDPPGILIKVEISEPMTQKSSFLCIAFLSALGLASCNMFSGNSGGTASEATDRGSDGGVGKAVGREAARGPLPEDDHPRGRAKCRSRRRASGASQVVTPDPVPLPQTATPPLSEQPPQPATPAQIQKLKN